MSSPAATAMAAPAGASLDVQKAAADAHIIWEYPRAPSLPAMQSS